MCSFFLFFRYYLCKKQSMKKRLFKLLARINKLIFPSFTKKRLDLSRASKYQMAIIGWRYFVTTNALD